MSFFASSSSSSSPSSRHHPRRTRSVYVGTRSNPPRVHHHHHTPHLSESAVSTRVLTLPSPDNSRRRDDTNMIPSPTPTLPGLPPLGILPSPTRLHGASSSPVGNNDTFNAFPVREPPALEARQPAETAHDQGNGVPPPGFVGKIMVWLGYAGADTQARRAFLSLMFAELWWLIQFVVVIALLAVSATRKSPTKPGLTEWSACDRPLGVWNALWIVKALMSACLSYWGWHRGHVHRMRARTRQGSNSDGELATQLILEGSTHYPANAGARAPPHRQQAGLSYEGSSGANRPNEPPKSAGYSRLSLLTSFLTLAWFLTAHVLEYSSVNSCRLSSPHLWWLTFALLCTLYLMVLEIFLLGLLVFVLGPVLYIMYNILLLCLGRHPLQNPHYIKPDITKLPKSVVDQIPLVLYIPTPPGESSNTNPSIAVPAPVYSPKSATSSASAAVPPKRRFMFFRRKKSAATPSNASPSGSKLSAGKEKEKQLTKKDLEASVGEEQEVEDVPWDEMWEKGDYPFVRLEGNRAVCAICLMDFEEPKRVHGSKGVSAKADAGLGIATTDSDTNAESGPSSEMRPGQEAEGTSGREGTSTEEVAEPTQEIQVEAVTEEERDALKLGEGSGVDGDEGGGPQPLRLLQCGHVFHQTCLDPWLTDVSGRCPICQRPVEVPQQTKKGKGRRS